MRKIIILGLLLLVGLMLGQSFYNWHQHFQVRGLLLTKDLTVTGDVSIDTLGSYYRITQADSIFALYYTQTEIDSIKALYYTITVADSLLLGKADTTVTNALWDSLASYPDTTVTNALDIFSFSNDTMRVAVGDSVWVFVRDSVE